MRRSNTPFRFSRRTCPAGGCCRDSIMLDVRCSGRRGAAYASAPDQLRASPWAARPKRDMPRMSDCQNAEARGEKKTKRTDQVCLCAATCLHVCVYTCIHDVQESTFSKDRAA